MNRPSRKYGSRIQALLDEQGISQRKLSADLHLSPNTVNGYIRNRRVPDCITLAQIADYLGTNTDYLLGNTDMRVYPDRSLSSDEYLLLNYYRGLDSTYRNMLLELSVALYFRQKKDHTD